MEIWNSKLIAQLSVITCRSEIKTKFEFKLQALIHGWPLVIGFHTEGLN